jgi:hypothetical protein
MELSRARMSARSFKGMEALVSGESVGPASHCMSMYVLWQHVAPSSCPPPTLVVSEALVCF